MSEKVSVYRCRDCGRVAVLNQTEVTIGPGRCRGWNCGGDLELMLRCAGHEEYPDLRPAALYVLANMVPISGTDVLVAVRQKDLQRLAKAAGYKEV